MMTTFRLQIFSLALIFISNSSLCQTIIPLDTTHWNIFAKAHIFEHYKGRDAIYIQGGLIQLKDTTFLNGSIEFDVFLSERQAFPGVRFRVTDPLNMESFFLRPHLSGKPDANQAAPVINGITAFQFYFGPSYSFAYDYNYDDWTHVKVKVNGSRAQVYLDHSETPQLSWNLVHPPKEGAICIGGSFAPMHYANFKIDKTDTLLSHFSVAPREPIPNIISSWHISDKFEESDLNDLDNLKALIDERQWMHTVAADEGVATNISREVVRYDSQPGNTVFAKITVHSEIVQTRLFEFGYSDRVVAILNGKPIYKGNNKWRSRDYRYLGTIGLFDSIYLDLKEGNNELFFAVSEDFGGWLITGRFIDESGLTIK